MPTTKTQGRICRTRFAHRLSFFIVVLMIGVGRGPHKGTDRVFPNNHNTIYFLRFTFGKAIRVFMLHEQRTLLAVRLAPVHHEDGLFFLSVTEHIRSSIISVFIVAVAPLVSLASHQSVQPMPILSRLVNLAILAG